MSELSDLLMIFALLCFVWTWMERIYQFCESQRYVLAGIYFFLPLALFFAAVMLNLDVVM